MKLSHKLTLSKATLYSLNDSEVEDVAAGKRIVIRHSLPLCEPTNPLICVIIGSDPLPW